MPETISKAQRDVLWTAMVEDLEGHGDALTHHALKALDGDSLKGAPAFVGISDYASLFEHLGWEPQAEAEIYTVPERDADALRRTLQRLQERAAEALADHAKDGAPADAELHVLDRERVRLCTQLLGHPGEERLLALST